MIPVSSQSSLHKKQMKQSVLYLSMAVAAGLTLTNIYTSLVDVPSWESSVPASIEVAREYYKVSNPANFFRIFSPLNQLLGLVCMVMFWHRSKTVRYCLIAAFILYVIGEGMTFEYFYPRNAILFLTDTKDVDLLARTLQEWGAMNWVRTAVIAAGLVGSSTALHFSYKVQPARPAIKVRSAESQENSPRPIAV
jgi:uncharacterized membrane protein